MQITYRIISSKKVMKYASEKEMAITRITDGQIGFKWNQKTGY